MIAVPETVCFFYFPEIRKCSLKNSDLNLHARWRTKSNSSKRSHLFVFLKPAKWFCIQPLPQWRERIRIAGARVTCRNRATRCCCCWTQRAPLASCVTWTQANGLSHSHEEASANIDPSHALGTLWHTVVLNQRTLDNASASEQQITSNRPTGHRCCRNALNQRSFACLEAMEVK